MATRSRTVRHTSLAENKQKTKMNGKTIMSPFGFCAIISPKELSDQSLTYVFKVT